MLIIDSKRRQLEGGIFIHTIAICDDDPIFLSVITKKTQSFFSNLKESVDIHTFPNGEAFFTTLSTLSYQLVLLDIDMPGKTGIEVSELLRSQDINATIIFISSHDSYVFQSLHYQPLRFIRKDYLEDELLEALHAYHKLVNKSEPLYTFKTTNQDIILPIKEILYFEVYTHNTTVHCIHDSFITRKTLNYFESEMKPHGFIRIHKSYLVSFRYIYSINPNSIILTNQTELPISRGKNKYIKEQYMHYFRELN